MVADEHAAGHTRRGRNEFPGNPTGADRAWLSVRRLPGPTAGEQQPEPLIIADWNMHHVSCRGPNGVCILSVMQHAPDARPGHDPLDGELVAVHLDASGVRRLGHHFSTSRTYERHAKPSHSQDGRYVIFTSDWGHPTEYGAYVIDLAAPPRGP